MDVVKVKKSALAALFKCSICKRTVVDATTITLCLHTFCQRCIYKKLTDEGETCCPICRVYLGNDPVEKLRVDHSLRNMRAIFLPNKKKMVNVPKADPAIVEPSSAKPFLPKLSTVEFSTANPSNEEPTNIEDMTLHSIYIEGKSRKAKARKKASASLSVAEPSANPFIAESSTANPSTEVPTNINEDMTLYSIYLEVKSRKAKAKKKPSASRELDAKQTQNEGEKVDNSANSGEPDQE